ncbi:chromate transporter [Niveibacterium sp. 24ML]|uniref:chromate transporter n=1 Tax=Niveibacterium sp. 24ML TaxID=2985512 RepID=UPI002270BC4F|nr:chromate transporter [Niveibacterium sp. 24ML]MCX9155721.1 chromate transporter [Niveibacterium sp. 24ML]
MDTVTLNPHPRCAALFAAFFSVGMRGFGGVLPWARRMLVDERHWLDDRGFTELLSLGQLLPGPNIVNLSVVFGARCAGWRGALAAASGLLLAPLFIVLLLAEGWRHFAAVPWLQGVLTTVAAAAAGLILATGAKLAQKLEPAWWSRLLAAATFVAIAWLRLPLLAVLAVAAPCGIALAWRDLQTEKRR